MQRVMKYARKLLRRRVIAAGDLVLFEAIAWGCQRAGGQFSASLNSLRRLTGSSKQAVVDRLARLERAGLVQRFKHGRLIQWGRGGSAWRQMPNSYAVNCESGSQTVYQVEGRKEEAHQQKWRVPPAPPQPDRGGTDLLERARRRFEARQRAALAF